MFRLPLIAAIVIGSSLATKAETATPFEPPTDENRLLIVNGNSGRVIYDDGRNDLFCVTRRHLVGYSYEGRPIFRRSMRCR